MAARFVPDAGELEVSSGAGVGGMSEAEERAAVAFEAATPGWFVAAAFIPESTGLLPESWLGICFEKL